jgi:hypothetical protein
MIISFYLINIFVCRFGYNAVPQINDIVISKSASLAYFGLSIFTIFLMFLQYETVSYGYKTAVSCWRILAGLYGLTVIALGIASSRECE